MRLNYLFGRTVSFCIGRTASELRERRKTPVKRVVVAGILAVTAALPLKTMAQQTSEAPFGLAIHGGAGNITREKMTPELEKAYVLGLEKALATGYEILKHGGRSFDAVEATLKTLEDSPLFNAGKGAVFTGDGTNELDASIMDGKTLQAGAVASVKHIKNPITLARLVLEKSPHVMLVGQGAEDYGVQHGVETVSNFYFYTERRWQSLQRVKEKQARQEKQTKGRQQEGDKLQFTEKERGTVGCVALDKDGNLSAGTSTGGLTNKSYGRVGDSPVIGAGTYANNQTCAVSGTGEGEYFMRLLIAYDVHALMAYQGLSLQEAVDKVILEKLENLGGTGGLIAIDKDGNIAMAFNTKGMYRASMDQEGKAVVEMYKE